MLSLRNLPEEPAPRTRLARRLRMAEYVLLALGFLGVGIFAYTLVDGIVYQSYEEYVLDSITKSEKATIAGYLKYVLSEGFGSSSDSADDKALDGLHQQERSRRPPPAPMALIGKIEIPRVNVSAIVREGTDSAVLRRSAGHVPGTALPGESGSVGVAAHRDTHFRGLRNIQVNDTIRLTTPGGTYKYVVRSTEIVSPKDVHVLDPRRPRELTLVTCYPFNFVGHAPNRFIVKAEQIDTEAREQKTGAAVFGAPAPTAPAAVAPPRPARKAAVKARSGARKTKVENLQLRRKSRSLKS